MLVLTRRAGEAILIGDDIVVHVLRTERGSVSLGIEAPKHVHILRDELVDAAAKKIINNGRSNEDG
jgi:carbon storage regulator